MLEFGGAAWALHIDLDEAFYCGTWAGNFKNISTLSGSQPWVLSMGPYPMGSLYILNAYRIPDLYPERSLESP